MDLLPNGGQGDEGNQKPECTDGMTQAVEGAFASGLANHNVLLVRSIEKAPEAGPVVPRPRNCFPERDIRPPATANVLQIGCGVNETGF